MTPHSLDDILQANQRALTELIAAAVEASEDEGTHYGRAFSIIKHLKARFASDPTAAHLLFQLYPTVPARIHSSLSTKPRKEREIRPEA